MLRKMAHYSDFSEYCYAQGSVSHKYSKAFPHGENPEWGRKGRSLALSPNRRNGLDSHDRSWTWGAITVPVGKM
jgi:hypothetical protein